MIIDKQNQFSDSQVITADAASTNLIDMGSGRDLGPGTPLTVGIAITEAFNTLTSMTIQVQCDDNTGFSSARTLTQLSLTLAELVLGRQVSVPLPSERVERYVRLNYDVVGTNPTLGKISAWLTTPDALQRTFANA